MTNIQSPGPSSFKLGLIGYPLSHSLSPQIHAAALQSCSLKGDYSLFPIHPQDKLGLKDLLNRVRSGEIHGLNVTIPHKQNVIPFLDELTPTAESIGAVNTVYLRDNRLIGENTDSPGFLSDLHGFLGDQKLSTLPSSLVLGAGGSARAIVYALLKDGWDVTIAARRMEQSQELALHYRNTTAIEFNPQTLGLSNVQLIVNTTPLGMTPHIDQSPWPENLPFPENAAMYDLVYNPPVTKLVRDAHTQGLNATTGLGMLIEQAALAFEIWTGHTPLREPMQASVKQSPVSTHQSSVPNYGVD